MKYKIAIATDDGTTVSPHFGKSPGYVVLTVDQGTVVERETRVKEICKGGHAHDHDDHDQAEAAPAGAESGEPAADPADGDGHHGQLDPISDCTLVLSGGMCQGMFANLEGINIRPVMTSIATIDAAVSAYLAGQLKEEPELVH